MKLEQKIVMIYTVLGLISGLITNYLYTIGLGLITAITAPFSIYFVSLPLLIALTKKKKTMLFYNSFITFLLIWLTIWILLYNLGG